MKKSEILGELTEWWAIHEDTISTHDAYICELRERVAALEKSTHELKRAIKEHRHDTVRFG